MNHKINSRIDGRKGVWKRIASKKARQAAKKSVNR